MSDGHDSEAPEPSSSSDLTGKTIGRFIIRAKLGAGGMGEVYRAEDTKLKRTVAIKRVAPELASDEQYRRRILKEAERASRLSSPHVAQIFDVLEEPSGIYLVMEFIQGETLAERLRRPMSLADFIKVAVECAEALVAAHEKSIIHCDLKPENIMLTPGGEVKILDFGVARELSMPGKDAPTRSLDTGRGTLRGTPAYMAPEVLLEHGVDARSDIFSLGVVFYESLSGVHPFRVKGFMATTDRVLHEQPAPLSEVGSKVPVELVRIVSRMLAKAPEERYPDAAELLSDLRRVKESLSSTTHPILPTLARRPRVRFAWPWAAGAVAVAALSGWAYWAWSHRPPAKAPPPTSAARELRSIAILPFRNIGQSPSYDYFGIGLAEVLNAKLTNARFLEVRSPHAPENLSETGVNPLDEGNRLGVDAVLSGSYQIEGRTLSLNYTLLDVRRNVQIAGDSIETPFVQAISVEHRLATAIVDALWVSATQAERAGFISATTSLNDAFQDYLRSNYEMDEFRKQPSAERLSRVEDYLRQALQADPRFNLAEISLAKTLWLEVFWGYARDPKVLDRAEEDAGLAIRQDPNLGEAYAVLALVNFQRGQLDKMRQSLREAFLRSPNAALAYYAAGYYYVARGLSDLSVEAFRHANLLNPALVRRELATAYTFSGDFERAEQQLREDLRAHPDDLFALAGLTHILTVRGNLQEAREIAPQLLRRAPDDPGVQSDVAVLDLRQGKAFPIQSWVAKYRQTFWSDAGFAANTAAVYALARQPDEALRWLRRAGELGMRNYLFLARNPLYDNLRKDPAFISYLNSLQREWEEAKQEEEKDPLLPVQAR
jgi:eukaryotic-like serine/threonine-protein kinase